MGERIFKNGLKTMQCYSLTVQSTTMASTVAMATASGQSAYSAACGFAAPGPLSFVVAGVIYSAQTGIDYRKYKNGKMTHDQFKKKAKRGAFASTGGVLGSAGGMVGGFFAGQLLIPVPVVGGVVGTFAGAMAGGITGAKISIKLYERMEEKMNARKEALVPPTAATED